MNAIRRPLYWRLACLILAGLCFAAAAAGADVTHRVSFSAGPQIMVWSDTAAEAGPEVRMRIGPGGVSTDARLPVISGNLEPIRATTAGHARHTLEIATNTAWQLTASTANGTEVEVQLLGAGAGPNATAQGLTLATRTQTLNAAPQVIAAQPVRTARTRGAPHSQTVRFDLLVTSATPDVEIVLHFSPGR